MTHKAQQEIYLILDRIRSLYNVGSLFRTADAFGVKKIYLCGYTGAPPRKEISKVALGAEKTVPWGKRGTTWKVVEELKSKGVQVAVLENISRTVLKNHKGLSLKYRVINQFHPRFPIALIVGNEVNGISHGTLERADVVVEIPMLGKKESLNVVVAAGIALYHIRNF